MLTTRRNSSPGPGRTPFRPTRPTSTSNTNQIQHGVNVRLEQLREVNKANIEMKKIPERDEPENDEFRNFDFKGRKEG